MTLFYEDQQNMFSHCHIRKKGILLLKYQRLEKTETTKVSRNCFRILRCDASSGWTQMLQSRPFESKVHPCPSLRSNGERSKVESVEWVRPREIRRYLSFDIVSTNFSFRIRSNMGNKSEMGKARGKRLEMMLLLQRFFKDCLKYPCRY